MSYHSKWCAVPGASATNRPLEGCTCGHAERSAAYQSTRTAVGLASREPAVDAKGARLVAEGWEQASRKYRMVRLGRKELTLDAPTFEAFRRYVRKIERERWAALDAERVI